MNAHCTVAGITVVMLTIGASSATATETEPLGRLFFTPQQRAALDRPPAPGHTAQRPRPEQDLRLDGVVRRSDGQITVWLNGTSEDSDVPVRFLADPRHPARIRLLFDRAPTLKVGDTWQHADGTTRPLLSPAP